MAEALSSPLPKEANDGADDDNSKWSDDQTTVLINAWASFQLKDSPRSLKKENWVVICDIVNNSEPLKPKTITQCKTRMDTLKRHYKKIKFSKRDADAWKWFNPMHVVLEKISDGKTDGQENICKDLVALSSDLPAGNPATAEIIPDSLLEESPGGLTSVDGAVKRKIWETDKIYLSDEKRSKDKDFSEKDMATVLSDLATVIAANQQSEAKTLKDSEETRLQFEQKKLTLWREMEVRKMEAEILKEEKLEMRRLEMEEKKLELEERRLMLEEKNREFEIHKLQLQLEIEKAKNPASRLNSNHE